MAASKKDKIIPPATPQYFPIVGVGASAGGLDAFKRLLKAIPTDSGMAYVLVQHLDPTHESMLPEILSRSTKIPVHQITDEIHLAPDHIYIIPSNKILTSTDGVLKLAQRDKKNQNLPIDIFFTSLAEVHTSFAVGIVLSGTGSDGTNGLRAIKAHRGITIAQDIESAAYDGMPQNAIDAGVVDFILPPEKIPEHLLQINNIDKTRNVPTTETSIIKNDEIVFKQILTIIRLKTGVDFTYYKQPTPRRRIARRMAICKTSKLSGYLKILRSNKAEQDALFQDMLIPVTSFFRDTKTFDELSTTIIPQLVKNKSNDEPIRVWIAGCSTGEEAYSIAICLNEYSAKIFDHKKIQIFASDISEVAIKKARIGIYSKADVQMLSEERLRTYFIKKDGYYEVNKLIRDMCVFATHNFLKDPPFAKMDLISCRNSLIYMDPFLQKKALTTFHYAIKENGFLLLGKSETTGTSSDLFIPVNKHEKIYSRNQVAGRFMHVATVRKEESLTIKDTKPLKPEVTQTDFRKSAEAILLSKFTPASVVVNEQMDVVHIHGIITPFLEAPQGKPTYNLLKMAREGLAFELRNLLHKVNVGHKTFTKQNIPISLNGIQTLVTIQIVPLQNTIEPHFLILFNKTVATIAVSEGKDKSSSASQKIKKDALLRIKQLENELAQTREDMRSITEEQEAANEELQSGNEELLSSSEELQTLNEELETSKEELQSTNEELTIINHELLDKQEQLNASRTYAESIVTTLREPLIVLDQSLRVKTANASFYKLFNAEESNTEGKLFYEIQNHQWDDPMMRTLLEKILPKHERLSDFEVTLKFPLLGERHLLMNARQIVNKKTEEQLILLAIEDITEQVTAQKIIEANKNTLEKERKLLHDFFTQAPAMLAIIKGPEFIWEFANPAFMEFIGNRNIIGKKLLDAIPEVSGQGFIELLDNVYKTGETFTAKEMPIKVDNANKKLQEFYVNFTYQAFANDRGETEGILIFAYDVTEQVEARKKIEANALLIRNIYMNAPASICTFKGPKHIYELVNPAYQKLFDKRDLVGKSLLEALPELKGQGVDKILDNVYNTGEIFTSTEIPVLLSRADNVAPEQRYFNTTMQPIYSEENKIIGVVNFGYDVTEQVEARKQIQASEKRFSNILSQSLLAIAILKGPEMIVAFANEPLIDIWGKGKNIFGKPLLEVMPEIKDQPIPQLLMDVYTTGVPFASSEIKVIINRHGKLEDCYFNLIYQPYRDVDDTITGITILATEITEYVLTKKQIEASEVFSRTVIESSPDCLQILDKEGRIQYMNPNGAYQMEIDDFAKIKNKHWWELWGIENKNLVKDAVEKGLKGETVLFSVFCPTAKRTPKWWDVLLSPASLTDEGVQQIIAVSRDVTERKTAEKLLLESEIKFRTLAETIPNMIWTASPDGTKNFFNKYFLDYTGMSVEELKDGGIVKIIFPGDLKEDLKLWNHSLKTGEDFNMEKRIQHHDGTYRWFISHSSAQKDIHGNITGWIGSNTDIEEQKKFAEELETKVKERTEQLQLQNKTFDLAENVAQLGSYKWNLTTGVLDYSDNLFRLFDCKPREFVPSFEKFLSFIHPNDLAEVIKNGEQTIQTGKFVETPYRIISKTGKIKHLRSTGNFSSEGVNKFLIGTIQDVSKDKEASEILKATNTTLKKTVEELKTTNQQLEQFANAASHDLQEPLRKIITFSMRLQDKHKGSLPEEVKIYLDKIQGASNRMTTLIKDLLNYSLLLDNEKLFSQVNLNETLTNILNDFELRIAEMKAVVQSDMLPTIKAIPLQMNQLFYNLLSNALKFTKANVTPIILISSRILSNQEIKNYPALANLNQIGEHRSYIEIIFKDNGIGFEQQYDKQIFGIFQRLHDSGTYLGTGIGLALCKKIVENHHGEIFVIAEENKGAAFHIILPIN